MIGYVEAPISWALIRGMARRAGVDVPRAVAEGWLSRENLAVLVDRCQSGGCTASCINLLGKPQGTHSHPPPAFCAIRAELEALAPVQK